MRLRTGSGLTEFLLAAVLGSVVLIAAASLVISHERLARGVRERVKRNEALRTSALLPRIEWRMLTPGDVRAAGSEFVESRLFRGFARACNRAGTQFEYTGIRDPDMVKDSAIVIAGDGSETVRAFKLVAPLATSSCTPLRGRPFTLAFDDAPPSRGSVLLIFESGTYYLSGSALRYRRGSEGRQPLTPEYVDTRVSRFSAIHEAPVRQPVSSGISIRLQGTGETNSVDARISFLNGSAPAPAR